MRGRVFLSALLCGFAAGGSAAREIAITGRAFDAEGVPVPRAEVELRAFPGLHELGRRTLAGREEPPPVVTVATGRDGAFRLAAPAPGRFVVVVRHSERLAMACRLEPLVGPVELPAVVLPRRIERRLRVLDEKGRPVAGARLLKHGFLGDGEALARFRWEPEVHYAATADDGSVKVPAAAGERLAVVALSGEGYEFASVPPGSRDVEVRLTGRLAEARVVDARGRPAPGLVAFVTERLPLALGVTGPGGEIRVRATEDGVPGVMLVDESGLVGWVSSKEPVGEKPVLLRLPDTEVVHGRVIGAANRDPIADAWVWHDEHFQRTGLRGSFSLRLPVLGAVLRAAAPGYLTQRLDVSPRNLPQGEVTMALVESRVRTGRVIDGEGRAVGGARIRAKLDRSAPAARRKTTWMRPDLAPREVEALSGADGRFRISGLMSDNAYQLHVTRRDFAERRLLLPALAAGQAPDDVEIVLRPGLGVFGVVVDADERPVAGAAVWLVQDHRSVEAEIGAAGRFAFSDLAPGDFSLRVVAAGFVPLSVPGIELAPRQGATDLGSFLLERGATLSGTVRDSGGRGLEGARVTVEGSESLWGVSGEPNAATSGPDGRFTLEGLAPAGRYQIGVRREGFQHKSLNNVGLGPDRPLDVVLEPSLTVRGRVVGPTGAGAAGMQVRLTRTRPGGGSSSSSRPTDGEGRFAFPHQGPGAVTVTARGPAGLADPLEVEINAGADPPGLHLVLRPAAVLSGRLVDARGVAVFDAQVSLYLHSPGVVERRPWAEDEAVAATDADGRFTTEGLAGGRYRLTAEHPEFDPLAATVEIPAGESRDLELAFGPRRDREALKVSGRVVDPAGDGVDGARVRLVGAPGAATTSFLGGDFELEAAKAGTYRLLAIHPDYAPQQSEPFEVGAARAGGLRIQLGPGGTVSGRVLGLEPAQFQQVEISATSDFLSHTSRVNADGSYLIASLGAGEWRVMASHAGTRSSTAENVVLGGEGDAVVVDLSFAEAHRLSGLAWRDGGPFGGAGVTLRCPGSHRRAYTAVLSDGRFSFDDVPRGRCELTLTDGAGGTVAARRAVEVPDDGEVVLEVTTAELSGRVLAAGDLVPLAGVELELWFRGVDRRRELAAATTSSDADGRFDFGSVGQGRWRLRAVADGFVAVERPVEAPASDLQVLLAPAVPAVIYVHDAAGEVPPRVELVVLDSRERLVNRLLYQPDHDGRVVLRSLGPGTWDLFVSAHSLGSARVELTVPGDAVRLTLAK